MILETREKYGTATSNYEINVARAGSGQRRNSDSRRQPAPATELVTSDDDGSTISWLSMLHGTLETLVGDVGDNEDAR